MQRYGSIALFRNKEEIWVAQEMFSGLLFHEPSLVPYRVIFIDRGDYLMLVSYLENGHPEGVFRFAQIHYGNLPGFSFIENSLTTPDYYAYAKDLVAPDSFLYPK